MNRSPATLERRAAADEKNFVPDLHFVEISKDRKVYIGERGQNRIQVFTTEGKWLQDIMVLAELAGAARRLRRSEQDPAGRAGPSLFNRSICGTTYKMVMSKDPQQKYLFVADAHNDVIWEIDRQSGKTLGHFGSSGRLAGQFHFANSIGIDTRGNIFVGEVDNGNASRSSLRSGQMRIDEPYGCSECHMYVLWLRL
jgi:hypothetical protein